MKTEKLKIWLNFGKFVLGTFLLGLVSLILNDEIQKSELNLKAQQIENKYIQENVDYYTKEDVGIVQKIDFIFFLKHMTINKTRKRNYNELYNILLVQKDSILLEESKVQGIIKELESGIIKKDSMLAVRTEEKNQLEEKLQNAPNEEKDKIKQEIKSLNDSVEKLEINIEEYTNSKLNKEDKILNNKKKIDNPLNESKKHDEITFETQNFTLSKSETFEVADIGVLIIARKVNNLTNRALIEIRTGEDKNNPIYSLGLNKYCIFSKKSIEYKLLVTNVFSKKGIINESTVNLELSRLSD